MASLFRDMVVLVVSDPLGVARVLGGRIRARIEQIVSRSAILRNANQAVASLLGQEEATTARPIVIAVVALLLIGMGVMAYAYHGDGAEPQLATAMQCLQCGKTHYVHLEAGQPLPTCSRCERGQLAPACTCPHCQQILVLNEYRGIAPPTICPNCRQEVRHGD